MDVNLLLPSRAKLKSQRAISDQPAPVFQPTLLGQPLDAYFATLMALSQYQQPQRW
jgi:hypothetical protein